MVSAAVAGSHLCQHYTTPGTVARVQAVAVRQTPESVETEVLAAVVVVVVRLVALHPLVEAALAVALREVLVASAVAVVVLVLPTELAALAQ